MTRSDDTQRDGDEGGRGEVYLFVLLQDSSFIYPLPTSGATSIGSSEDAGLRIHGHDVEPHHAVLEMIDGNAVLTPSAGAQLSVNGERCHEPVLLNSGDALALGSACLGYHGDLSVAHPVTLLSLAELRRRLWQEVERSLRTSRPVAVLAIELGAIPSGCLDQAKQSIASVVRMEDHVGSDEGSVVIAVLPDTGEAAAVPAGRILNAASISAPEASCGLAICPHDGVEPAALLHGARRAAAASKPGSMRRVAETLRTITAGEIEIIIADPKMEALYDLAERVARSDMPVLIHGETGAGKEAVAAAVHAWSPRRARRLVALNCASVTETLFESELLGHERGAFTGAISAKPGLLETANGGTILLDEIGECAPTSQAKLLRVLETGRFTRVGSVKELEVDVRIVSVTNRVLEEEVEAGRFRRDLFYRLNAAALHVPPLRDRPLEVPILARSFLDTACADLGRSLIRIATDTAQVLSLHDWPGNVRELKHMMEYLATTIETDLLEAKHLPRGIASSAPEWKRPQRHEPSTSGASSVDNGSEGERSIATTVGPPPFRKLKEEIEELERLRIAQALEAAKGVKVRAAELIGMPLRTFLNKLKAHGLTS